MFKIKRDGQEITSSNKLENNRGANSEAISIIKICSQGYYEHKDKGDVSIKQELKYAIDNSIIIEDIEAPNLSLEKTIIKVVNSKANSVMEKMLENGEDNIAILNFANGKWPGGGFLSNARAQEEDLCRASGLYPCLKNKPEFYNKNLGLDEYCSDDMIYSPNVPFFKSDNGSFLEKPYLASVITAPAPCLINKDEADQKELKKIFERRIIKILSIAASKGHKNLVLGAWGTGAFGNDPVIVANAFKDGLSVIRAFNYVNFAVYDTRNPPYLFETFKEILNGD